MSFVGDPRPPAPTPLQARQQRWLAEVLGVPLPADLPAAPAAARSPWVPVSIAQSTAFDSVLQTRLAQGASEKDARQQAAEIARLVATREQVEAWRERLPALRLADPARAERAEALFKAFDRALLAQDVYFDAHVPGLLPAGTQRLDPTQAKQRYGLGPDMLNNPGNGYYAALYETTDPATGQPKLLYVNRGTEGALNDIGTDVVQALGGPSAQYEQAMLNAVRLARDGVDVEYSGHSLGGGLAMAQALRTGSPATTMNAAGVHPDTLARYGVDFSHAGELIDAYHLEGDALNRLQDGGKYLLAAGAVAGLGVAGIALAPALVGLPAVQGDRHALPAVHAPTQEGDQYTAGEAYGTLESLWPGAMLEQHRITTMIHSLAAQAQAELPP
ncbi:hypothetical protein KAK06_15300 [Ideonella sp. 4Y11]|uniref:DUF2974 domain-containing protein n=1 Tax=Ideonella aquatica TaxID=2824119 RepID=A0A940YHQ4_9BURK|nr:hypothetical protein [Ideonella aquatica]MBQ0960320.1 hypothetical protein [Ideonella aquatica]